MKKFMSFVFVMAVSTALIAEEADKQVSVKSGLQPGKMIGAFNVTKCAGAADDGVEEGANLCYRCKNGGRPQVIIFTRSAGGELEGLVKQLDLAVAKHSENELRAFVNVLGGDKKDLLEVAKELGSKTKAKAIPFVVPNEFKNGPEDYGLNPKAELTVIIAKGGKVVANHAFSKGELDKDGVKSIIKDVTDKAI
jgi:hypothetical protein